ncbi:MULTISPECIES: SDR family NAD(P)-dependent oxidoreductase [Burkholderiales]|jgi:NAD(P)-dependent dehydrogenase (short-subunit alcohol dehydrogenase family)|uniref:SDR family NAD(P)-dependent oxidoreductase n=1 Tax=Burkholderiales TaxID=80840 RepID=UPI00272F1671|nr:MULTISPECIES: SDR family NAD(P)-dependent oxidoreductase [Burkholderiales]MDP1530620.1 SDR family NAD(P)-dependent oxidoreductase [Rhodoferax sp.]MDP1944683.1 SDR family NAD(P)-dependent oxidoreductase [Rhodoferax sp.]MDP2443555.1 SDR family NAD(P)-dependent oxidoreductase [Rhodoferax sp.]MDP3272420.1 SDR family NAD(P)-dependent oxidoreductase [Limnobacter sp.]MDP3337321.1 SDR family NAD(P)-dependent oxidoreductase [Rhodoferax sp.]
MALNARMTDWTGRRVWLVGASSGIGRATAQALHAQGAQVIVSARDAAALDDFASQHAGAQAVPLDVTDAPAVKRAAQALLTQGPLDAVVYCAGHYRAMTAVRLDLPDLLRHNQVNYLGALHVLDAVLPGLLAQPQDRRGHISLMASVAGYRGLPNSLAYGPTKAALINLAETLYLDLHAQGVGVSLVNPGFVETPLTAQNSFKMPALISPAQAAQAILKGWARGQFEIHFPKRFTFWLKMLRCLPYPVYFALTRRLKSH